MRILFWNVDTQYDFMRNDDEYEGKLVVEGAKGIEPALAKLTKLAKEHGINVVNTGDWHTNDSEEVADEPDFAETYPPHCLADTKGAEYVPATKPENPYVIDWSDPDFDEERVGEHRNIVLHKDAFDVFVGDERSPHAERVLDILDPDRVFVYGVAANVCVNFAALGLLERGYDVFIVTDAVQALPEEQAAVSYSACEQGWKDKGAKLITTEGIEEYL